MRIVFHIQALPAIISFAGQTGHSIQYVSRRTLGGASKEFRNDLGRAASE
jgi:hypothetical protein